MPGPCAKKERARIATLMVFEKRARLSGFQRIAGVDEAGRGPLAGPVVAAACVLPKDTRLFGIDDSKKLSAAERLRLFQEIISLPGVDYGLGIMDVAIIDQVNILQATFMAMVAAISRLNDSPDFLLVDGNQLPPTSIAAEAIVGGDGLSQSIAAASILAKHTRDQLMLLLHEKWPQYGFDQHKGYGTKQHLLALSQHGPCPIHRMTFKPKNGSWKR